MILNMTQKANNGTESLVEKFPQFTAASTQPKWLLPVRKAGLASFAADGFPTLHDEDWRFTNVAPIAKLNFQFAAPVAVNGAESKAMDAAVFTHLPGNRLVFVNGFYSDKLSRLKPVTGGVRIEGRRPHRKAPRPIRPHRQQRLRRAQPGLFLRWRLCLRA
jgi:Fe-S cluster assembly protein SufD